MVRLTSLAVITLLLAFAGWQALRSAAIPPLRTMPAAFTESVPAVSPAITLLPSETPLPAPSKTSVPATTTPSGPTSLAGVPHVLDIPFKVGERGFLIHRVREGENFEVLEVTYVTTSKVILALNHSLTSPLWANKVIVVSPGLQIVDPDLPAFEPYQLTDEEISIDALAKKLRVDAALLRYYNNCPDGCQLEAGNWLIIPHPEP